VPDSLVSQELSQEQLACVVRRGHPAPAKPSLRDYARLDHLVVSPTAVPASEPQGYIDSVLGKKGLRRRVALTVPHFLVAPFVVASSDLILTAPIRLLDPFAKLLRLRRIELPVKLGGYKLSQVWAGRSSDDEAHRWLRAAIAKTMALPPK
jgi:DNA-binding transcriptional LysR family regulator